MSERYTDFDGFPRADVLAPGAYSGVRTRRILGFFVDYAIVLFLTIPVGAMVTLLGIVTLGLGWLLYGLIIPVVAILYVAFTMGGHRQATVGMRLFDLRLERLDGLSTEPVFAVLHGVLFWTFNTLLTPAVLLVSLFTARKQLLHDLLLGTVVVRAHR